MKSALLAVALFAGMPMAAQEVVGAALDLENLELPGEIDTRLRSAVERGDYRAAEAILYRQSSQQPSGPLLEALGAVHYINERYFAAAQALARADRLQPIGEQSRLTLALACIQLGRRHWARPHLERLQRENPESPVYPHRLASIFYTGQRLAEAQAAAREAVARNPEFGPGHDILGQTREAMGDTAQALAAYRRAVARDAESDAPTGWPQQHLGALLRELGRLEEAEEALRDALRIAPGLAAAHYELGLLLEAKDELEPAIASLEKAADLDPVNPQVHYALAAAYRRAGDRDSARRALETFQRITRGR